MKRIILTAVLIVCFGTGVYAAGSVEYIQSLALKDKATVSDAVHLFTLQNGGTYSAFPSAKEFLVKKGILKDRAYDETEIGRAHV